MTRMEISLKKMFHDGNWLDRLMDKSIVFQKDINWRAIDDDIDFFIFSIFENYYFESAVIYRIIEKDYPVDFDKFMFDERNEVAFAAAYPYMTARARFKNPELVANMLKRVKCEIQPDVLTVQLSNVDMDVCKEYGVPSTDIPPTRSEKQFPRLFVCHKNIFNIAGSTLKTEQPIENGDQLIFEDNDHITHIFRENGVLSHQRIERMVV